MHQAGAIWRNGSDGLPLLWPLCTVLRNWSYRNDQIAGINLQDHGNGNGGIDAGDAVHGCSVHVVTAELDDGPILGQAEVVIEDGDTAEILAARLLPKEHLLYPEVLQRYLLTKSLN